MSEKIVVKTWVGTVVGEGDAAAARASRKDQAKQIATLLAELISSAQHTLSIAIYDFRLEEPEAGIVIDAINGRAEAGVLVRVAYFDQTRTQPQHHFTAYGSDPAPKTDRAFFGRFHANVKSKAITEAGIQNLSSSVGKEAIAGGGHLMHSKYVIVDGLSPDARVWTGSANFTTDAWTVQDNNIVIVQSQDIAGDYATDFAELWDSARIAGTGKNDIGSAEVDSVQVDVAFSPGEGTTIDHDIIAGSVNMAQESVAVASMVISSGTVLGALNDAIERGVKVSGIYDGPEMHMVESAWGKGQSSAGKLALWQQVKGHLIAKHSVPYSADGLHNFMHNKCIVVDGQIVATGSFNFSQNATRNAENVLTLHSPDIAKQYSDYIAELVGTYR